MPLGTCSDPSISLGLKRSSNVSDVKSLNYELNLNDIREDFPAANCITKGLTIRPLSYKLGGTASTR